MKNSGEKKGKARISIRWKLFTYLAVFIVFALAVTWLFQVRLLGHFYENVKKKELLRVADVIEENIDSETLETIVYQYATDNSLCVRILRIDNTDGVVMAYEEISVDINDKCVLHHITNDYLSRLYKSAKNNGGEYLERKTHKELAEEGSYYSRFFLSQDKDKIKDTDSAITSAVYIRLVSSADSKNTYVVLLNAEMTPVDAVTRMLTVQYIWIAALMLVGALALAMLTSRNISTPIEKMNLSAKKLAEGNYDADFSGSGFRELCELGDALNYASGELSRNDRLQKELIANISHDLRTPLTMITGYSEVMRDIPGENTPENVQVIIDEASRLSELVSDMLDLSKLQAGAGKPEISAFDLTGTVRDTMHRYSKLTEQYGYRIEFYYDSECYVEADRKMLLQVIYNLINNAVNYIGEDKLVIVRQTQNDGRVRISVTDHGEGIAPEQIPQIWDRYYKVDKVHRRAAIGTGIGLSIVKNILELHSAAYGVDSTPGMGSTFWFELPVSDNAGKDEYTDERL